MFCECCRKIIEARIKYLRDLDKRRKTPDDDRYHAIQQLEYLLDNADNIIKSTSTKVRKKGLVAKRRR